MLAVFQDERFLGVLHIARTRDMGANKSDTVCRPSRLGSEVFRNGGGSCGSSKSHADGAVGEETATFGAGMSNKTSQEGLKRVSRSSAELYY